MSEVEAEFALISQLADKHKPCRFLLCLEVDATGRQRLRIQGMPDTRLSKLMAPQKEQRD